MIKLWGRTNSINVQPNSLGLTFQFGTLPAFVSRPFISITGTSGNWNATAIPVTGGNWLSLSPSSENPFLRCSVLTTS